MHKTWVTISLAIGLLTGPSPFAMAAPALATPAAGVAATRSATPQSDQGNSAGRRSEVFAIDLDHHTVVLARADGRAPRTVVKGLINPTQIAVTPQGTLYVIDEGTQRLMKVNHRGGPTTIRQHVIGASMAVDSHDNLYLHEGNTVLKYSSRSKRFSTLGSLEGVMTVDGAGNVSVTVSDWGNGTGAQITTLPVAGGPPVIRRLQPEGNQDYFGKAIEGVDGSIYLEQNSTGGSGASYILRVPPGSSTGSAMNTKYALYAYTVDRRGTFYLMQSRHWCPTEGGPPGTNQCKDDLSVDAFLMRSRSSTAPTAVPVSGLQLPIGGMAVDNSGNIFAAVAAPWWYTPEVPTKPQLVRIGANGGAPKVLADGHFSMPTVAGACW